MRERRIAIDDKRGNRSGMGSIVTVTGELGSEPWGPGSQSAQEAPQGATETPHAISFAPAGANAARATSFPGLAPWAIVYRRYAADEHRYNPRF